MSSCTSFRRESTLFTIFERNDNCIFLSIIPPLKLMVFSCCQTICLQQRLNELYSVNHHSALSIGQQPVWNLKGHGKFSGARSNRNRLPIFPLQNADMFPSAYCSYNATRCFTISSFSALSFSSCRSSVEKQINALRSRSCRIPNICSACFICSVSAFRTICSRISSEIGIRLQGLSTAVAENLQLKEGPSFLRTRYFISFWQ